MERGRWPEGRRVPPGAQALGDTEIDQLHAIVAVDQNVGWLEVAVHDQQVVRRLHRAAGRHHQAHAPFDSQGAARTIGVDGFPVDELHDHVRAAIGESTAIQQPRYVGMVELRQDAAFQLESDAR